MLVANGILCVSKKHYFFIFHIRCKPQVRVMFFQVWYGCLCDAFEEGGIDVQSMESPVVVLSPDEPLTF
jgi:hypothetical protein